MSTSNLTDLPHGSCKFQRQSYGGVLFIKLPAGVGYKLGQRKYYGKAKQRFGSVNQVKIFNVSYFAAREAVGIR